MAKFIAIRDSFGYAGTYWKEGDTVEAAELPNEHFVEVKEKVAEEPAKAPVTTKAKSTSKKKAE